MPADGKRVALRSRREDRQGAAAGFGGGEAEQGADGGGQIEAAWPKVGDCACGNGYIIPSCPTCLGNGDARHRVPSFALGIEDEVAVIGHTAYARVVLEDGQ